MQLIRLPNSALNTLQSQYGDYVYIDGERYQLEQVVNDENDMIRMPGSARTALELKTDTVIRDSDLRGVFEDTYLQRNMHNTEVAKIEADGNETKLQTINDTVVNIGSQITTRADTAKILKVYVNDTKVAQETGVIENGTYPISINNITYQYLLLNTSSEGMIYNTTYQTSNITVYLEENGANSTNIFVQDSPMTRFLNIDIKNNI